MNVQLYVITPLAGAVIGYFTNWLAIKMLFRPHNPVYIGKFHLPLTPGLIPKERYRLSKAVGSTIAEHLITEETIVETLQSPEVEEQLGAFLEQLKDRMPDADWTVKNLLAFLHWDEQKCVQWIHYWLNKNLLSTENIQKMAGFLSESVVKYLENHPVDSFGKYVLDYLTQWIEQNPSIFDEWLNLLEDKGYQKMEDLKQTSVTLGEILPENLLDWLKKAVQENMPAVCSFLSKVVSSEEFDAIMKEYVIHAIENNTGKLASLFVNPQKIYDSAMQSAQEYLQSPARQIMLAQQIGEVLDNYSAEKVSELLDRIPQDVKEKWADGVRTRLKDGAAQEMVKQLLDIAEEKIDDSQGFSLMSLLEKWDAEPKEKIREALLEIYQKSKFHISLDMVKAGFDKIKNYPLKPLLTSIFPLEWDNIKSELLHWFQNLLKKYGKQIYDAFDISNMVEEQVNAFEIDYAESIIIDIARKELNAITYVGGVLGFIIGFVPAILDLLPFG